MHPGAWNSLVQQQAASTDSGLRPTAAGGGGGGGGSGGGNSGESSSGAQGGVPQASFEAVAGQYRQPAEASVGMPLRQPQQAPRKDLT